MASARSSNSRTADRRTSRAPPSHPKPPQQEWTDFLYMRDNSKGLYAERWRHSHGCGKFFNALRDTTTDHFVTTYKVGERP